MMDTAVAKASLRGGGRVRLVAALIGAALLSSCKTPSFLCVAPSGLRHLAIQTDASTNNGLALRIDLLFITDKAALRVIEALKARDYFAQSEQLRRDFAAGYRVRSFGLEPTQFVDPKRRGDTGKDREDAYEIEPPCNLAGTLLFVDYNNDAANRIKLSKAKAGTLVLGTDSFVWRK